MLLEKLAELLAEPSPFLVAMEFEPVIVEDLSGEDERLCIFAKVDLFDIEDTICEEDRVTEGSLPKETCVVINVDGLASVDERFPLVITVDDVCVAIILFV